ncbi:MAG: DUF1990 family protein [Deltaproteobacteria bacterium]|nr:DUF1990 family protein [Deltaproteobacteria bacterium]
MLFLRSGAAAPLAAWASRPFAPTTELGRGARDRDDSYERVIGNEPPGPPEPKGLHRRAAAAILGYDIFPASIGRGVIARNPVEVGDTVGLRYRVALGLEMFFASRVIARFDEQREQTWHTGFTYRTLQGHPELGEETFSVEKNVVNGEVLVALRSWSRPGILLSKLASPFARLAQVRASRAALGHLALMACRPVAASER